MNDNEWKPISFNARSGYKTYYLVRGSGEIFIGGHGVPMIFKSRDKAQERADDENRRERAK